MKIETSDYGFVGAQAVGIVQLIDLSEFNVVKTEVLSVELRFIVEGELQFDRSSLEIDPIRCSPDDVSWSFEIPPVLEPEIAGDVSVEIKSSSVENMFVTEKGEVRLEAGIRTELMRGEFSPVCDYN